jgi:hypothetical protein
VGPVSGGCPATAPAVPNVVCFLPTEITKSYRIYRILRIFRIDRIYRIPEIR